MSPKSTFSCELIDFMGAFLPFLGRIHHHSPSRGGSDPKSGCVVLLLPGALGTAVNFCGVRPVGPELQVLLGVEMLGKSLTMAHGFTFLKMQGNPALSKTLRSWQKSQGHHELPTRLRQTGTSSSVSSDKFWVTKNIHGSCIAGVRPANESRPSPRF